MGEVRLVGRNVIGNFLHQVHIGQFYIAVLVGIGVAWVILQLKVGGAHSPFSGWVVFMLAIFSEIMSNHCCWAVKPEPMVSTIYNI